MIGIELLVILLIVGALAYSMWRGLRLPASTPREPACAHCHYPVRGLQALRCPECGADLREIGIVSPWLFMRSRSGPWGVVIAWTLIVLIVGIAVSGAVSQALVSVETFQRRRLVPDSGLYDSIEVHVASRGRATPRPYETTLTLGLADGRAAAIVAAPPSLRFTASAPDGARSEGESLDARAILDWMAAAGLDPDRDPALRDEARALEGYVRAAQASARASPPAPAGFSIATGASGTMPVLPSWYPAGALAVWVAVWGLGLYFIVRGRRALLRPPGVFTPPAA